MLQSLRDASEIVRNLKGGFYNYPFYLFSNVAFAAYKYQAPNVETTYNTSSS